MLAAPEIIERVRAVYRDCASYPQVNIEIEEKRFTFEPPFIGKPRWA